MPGSDRTPRRPPARRRGLPPAGHEWAPEDVPALARALGLGPLDDHHWKVLSAYREEAVRTGHPVSLERISSITGLDSRELSRLFPGDCEAIVAHLTGIQRPTSDQADPRGGRPPGRTAP